MWFLWLVSPMTLSAQGSTENGMRIDRKVVVSRNNPKVMVADPLAALSVGNGHFATTVDVTGMQSYPFDYKDGVPLTAMADWGWHRFPNTAHLKESETQRTFRFPGRQHDEVYAVEYKQGGRQQDATTYFRVNPHRLNLGTIGLALTHRDGSPVELDDITEIRQELKLYEGCIESSFQAAGQQVEVTTACRQDCDACIYRIKSPLLRSGQAAVSIRFSYPTGKHSDDANDWQQSDKHFSRIVQSSAHSAVIERTLDDTRYYLILRWEGHATLTETQQHLFTLTTEADVLTLEAAYAATPPQNAQEAFIFDPTRHLIQQAWANIWEEGAIVDFSRCTDPRAPELERRVVLSQYLTNINCANNMPPQETGLTYNSWFGRPHLEMALWHTLHFALWNRPQVLGKMLKWYNDVAYPEARKIAERQGFKGIRWMKMTDPWAGEAPSNTGSFLIWQQPHYIYLAEEMYRAHPTAETLNLYARQVEETAEFMADFVTFDAATHTYHLTGATAMQESMSKDFSHDHPFELAYWRYGLQTAQTWRERQGLTRHQAWDDIIHHLAPLPEQDGIYTAGTPVAAFNDTTEHTSHFDPFTTPEQKGKATISKEAFEQKSRSDHPAILGVAAFFPDTNTYSPSTMLATLRWIQSYWNWPTTWGWDYGMAVMAATRLHQPDLALQLLLSDEAKNRYLVSGHNFQTADRLRLYLPGNGALLTAIAMMCAGWDGCPEVNNPGFPTDGTWNVRWEGLHRLQ